MADEVGGGRPEVHSRLSFLCSPCFLCRLPLLLCALAITVPVYYKSRQGRESSPSAAFSIVPTSQPYVRVSGDVRHAGMYPLSANIVTASVINMAEPIYATKNQIWPVDDEVLVNGLVLHITVGPDGRLYITRGTMSVSERLIMGIPLDLTTMTVADFDRVPGIGPKMAQSIVTYRQINGGVMRVSDLLFIAGIGEKKYKSLLKYF